MKLSEIERKLILFEGFVKKMPVPGGLTPSGDTPEKACKMAQRLYRDAQGEVKYYERRKSEMICDVQPELEEPGFFRRLFKSEQVKELKLRLYTAMANYDRRLALYRSNEAMCEAEMHDWELRVFK